MRCNIQSVKSTLRSVTPLNDPYGSNELNKPLTDRYNAGVLDNPREEEQRKIFEAQKKALDGANLKIAKYETPAVDTPVDTPVDKNVLSATQWLSVISIIVSLAGIYYKREEIKGLFAKPTPAPPNLPVDFAPKPTPIRGIKPMD